MKSCHCVGAILRDQDRLLVNCVPVLEVVVELTSDELRVASVRVPREVPKIKDVIGRCFLK